MLLAAALPATDAQAEGLRATLTFGLGAGHALLGPQAEVGYDHVSASFAVAPVDALAVAFGARWSLRPSGEGFGVALHGFVWRTSGALFDETTVVLAATAHWRWKWGVLVLDAGAGPAFSIDSYRSKDEGFPKSLQRSTCAGFHTDVGQCGLPLDLELAAGIGF